MRFYFTLALLALGIHLLAASAVASYVLDKTGFALGTLVIGLFCLAGFVELSGMAT